MYKSNFIKNSFNNIRKEGVLNQSIIEHTKENYLKPLLHGTKNENLTKFNKGRLWPGRIFCLLYNVGKLNKKEYDEYTPMEYMPLLIGLGPHSLYPEYDIAINLNLLKLNEKIILLNYIGNIMLPYINKYSEKETNIIDQGIIKEINYNNLTPFLKKANLLFAIRKYKPELYLTIYIYDLLYTDKIFLINYSNIK